MGIYNGMASAVAKSILIMQWSLKWSGSPEEFPYGSVHEPAHILDQAGVINFEM
jgi:hypothetical protein